MEQKVEGEGESGLTDRSILNIADILDFAETVDVEDIRDILSRQIQYNTAIAEEGLRGNYGSNIGSVLLDTYGTGSVMVRAKAMAAAGSDARMNGCELPVIINSGSGNQGMTTSLPVIEYAKELQVSEEKLYRALAVANLVTIHQKTSIGRLSAFCGAVSAGAGAGAGIAYLLGTDLDGISHTVANAIATTGGIVCDGAKASCASKIATAVEAGILGYNMHVRNQNFQPDDGLVGETPEETIANIGRLGKQGMKHTNEEIIKIMVGE
jgi:L-cysteine desulfidase